MAEAKVDAGAEEHGGGGEGDGLQEEGALNRESAHVTRGKLRGDHTILKGLLCARQRPT